MIETDPRRFDRIVGNLLDNAREHAPGAPVRVSAALDGEEKLVIAVEDGEAGLEAEKGGVSAQDAVADGMEGAAPKGGEFAAALLA